MVAPAGPFEKDPFEQGLEVLRSRFGLVPRFRDDVGQKLRYLAGDDGRRLAEWLEAVKDADARAIWCARGGYGSMHLLPRLETAQLQSDPRWVVGFSDITALHTALNQDGLVTVHGPNVVGLSKLPPAALDHLEALLFGSAGPKGIAGTAVIHPGTVSGPLLGGSLTLLAHLCGTRWQPRLAGAVLFLEDVGEKPYKLDRYFTQLRLSGALQGVAGVAVGQLTDCLDAGVQGSEVLRELVAALDVPALEGIPAGHEGANWALPLGVRVTLVAPGKGETGEARLLFEQGRAR